MASYRRVESVEAPTGLPAGQEAAKAATGLPVDMAVLRAELAAARERINDMIARAERAEAEADRAREEAAAALAKEREAWSRVAGLIEGPRAEPRGWWARLVGR
jgi:hypothetical protein